MAIYVGTKRYAPYIGDKRRRYMGGVAAPPYDENSYIQDGLVFQLDGINKGSNQGYWTDLKGGCTFTIPASNVDVLDKGFEFTQLATMSLSSGTVPNNTTYTVEVVFVIKKNARQGLFGTKIGSTSGDIAVIINGSANVFMQRQPIVKERAIVNNLSRYSYNLDVCCVDGVQGTFNNSDYWSVINVGVGNLGGSSGGIIGIVHAIRIYDHKLTLAEMQFNQDIDLKRFGT